MTGAGSGIGKASAVAFAREGATIVATTRSNLDGLAGTVAAAPHAIEARQADSAVAGDVEATVAHAEQRFGRLDILVNNAGLVTEAPLTETTEEDWDRTIALNLKGPFLGCKYAIPAMRRAGGGSIVNIGSINSFVASPLEVAYCAAKGGLVMVTKCAALGYAADKIRVNAVCPGWIQTPSFDTYVAKHGLAEMQAMAQAVQPLGLGRPEQVAAAVVFLASDEASLVTGTSLLVDGGYTAQ